MIAWPPTPTDAANAKATFDAWIAEKVSPRVAFAMLAQHDFESNFDPNAKGDYYVNGKLQPWRAKPVGTPTAFGSLQRQQARLDAIKAATGIDIMTAVKAGLNTVANDVAGAMWELETKPAYGLASINEAATARDAAILACQLFERATTSASDRGARAEQWLAWATTAGWVK